MRRIVKSSSILFLLAPLLLGAIASKRESVKKDVASNAQMLPSAQQVWGPPTSAAQSTTLETPVEVPGLQTPMPSANAATYAIDWYSINGGGTVNTTSTNYQVGASVGQAVAGAATSANYQMGIGFWYGAGTGGGCACDCHADPGNCDGVQTVLDVVQTVNVAFRNSPAIPDPNANCPYQTTDVTCDNVTTVTDVVKMVNVTFRNANAATEFCNPCL